MPKDKPRLYYARRPFGYTDDLWVDEGQVVELRGVLNDEKLTRLGYFGEVPDAERGGVVRCGVCEAEFLTLRHRERHGDRRHRRPGSGLDASPMGAGGAYADDDGDADERRLEREAPLYLDKTEASQR